MPLSKKRPVYVKGMHGIGDNINQRMFIDALSRAGYRVELQTPLPQLYADLSGVTFIPAETTLRTQQKNEQRAYRNLPYIARPSPDAQRIRIMHDRQTKEQGESVVRTMTRQFGIAPAPASLPHFRPSPLVVTDKPVAVIRPTTVRNEWKTTSRGPLNEYIDMASRMLAARGYHCVSVADLNESDACEKRREWVDGMVPFAHQRFHHGELSLEELLSLTESAAVVVSGDCLLLHAAIAYGTPLLAILGGMGGACRPEIIADPSHYDLSKVCFIKPDNFCLCQEMTHNCDKHISGPEDKIAAFLDGPVFRGG